MTTKNSIALKPSLHTIHPCRAHILNAHMRDRALKFASKTADVEPFESKGLHGILIQQSVAVIFKKLDGDRNPRNNLTSHMEDYLKQEQIDGIPAPIKLIAGYTENKETGEMADAYVIRPSGVGQNRWEMPLRMEDTSAVVQELFEDDEEIEEADIRERKKPAEIIQFKDKDGE